ncbi:MAG: hypothetical protein IJH09_03000 [Clostridia bacterium]|nr:hypothetical protein [Clostridia bacterium]
MNAKKMLAGLAAALLVTLALCALPASAEADSDMVEWTVLFYMCGSDLESSYSYATGNLEEISRCQNPYNALAPFGMKRFKDDGSFGTVDILIQTGGCKQWHADQLGMDVRTDALQRWRYDCNDEPGLPGTFTLEEDLPLQSMANSEVLADFIRWGAQTHPAKKYALVLWDHGGGSKTGIFIDELFKGDVMYLDELGDALRGSGVHLEAVLFDACMMANFETACAIQDSANWMVASEEQVAGKGTAINAWLQQLIYDPQCDGEWLGRWICEMSQIKYSTEGDEQSRDLLTWSVIDLSKIGAVAEVFDAVFARIGEIYVDHPALMSVYAKAMATAEAYGGGYENMRDLADVFYRQDMTNYMPAHLRWEMLDALKETVVYSLRGPGRSAARGLSFCYAVDFDVVEMETYARNCPSPHYLAFLDAITPWTAPDSVYEQVQRLPEMDSLDAYRVVAQKVVLPDGTAGISFPKDCYLGAGVIHFGMVRAEREMDRAVALGEMPAFYDRTVGENGVFCAVEPWLWPAVEGVPCFAEVISIVEPGATSYFGNIPIQIGTDKWFLRYSYSLEQDEYTVYGLWEGYDSDNGMFNRNVKSLAQLAGREYRLLYPEYTSAYDEHSSYAASEPMTMYRGLQIEDVTLPEGTYVLQYVVYDMFMRPMPMELIEVYWDGETIQPQEGFKWKGEVELKVQDSYWAMRSKSDDD